MARIELRQKSVVESVHAIKILNVKCRVLRISSKMEKVFG